MHAREVWEGTVSAPLGLSFKPRYNGLTMVIDKGLGPRAFLDMLEMGSEYIDFIKLAFGTSLLYKEDLLKQKISATRQLGIDIYPGGTFLEIAVYQGTEEATLERICELGFTAVEVSEGTVSLTETHRRSLIASAQHRGLRVISEVGKKDRKIKLTPMQVHAQVAQDLEAGAERVIIEGRDSGVGVGVYDESGAAMSGLVEKILGGIKDPNVLIWEAPQVSQQQHWLLRLGSEVNLGNVQPQDVITLAATRAGLRGDTLRLCVEQQQQQNEKTS